MSSQLSSFRPENFLELCEDLIDLGSSFQEESLYRTLVNRCYYTSYLSCAMYELQLPTDEYNSHAEVYYELSTELQSHFLRLRKKRLAADYILNLPAEMEDEQIAGKFKEQPVNKKTAKQAIRVADMIITKVVN